MATRDVPASRHPAASKPGWADRALGMVGQLVLWLLFSILRRIDAADLGVAGARRRAQPRRLEREAAYIN